MLHTSQNKEKKGGGWVETKQINGKPKQVFLKHGQEYTRKGYDVKVQTAERFSKKCDMLGYTESLVIEKLVESFVLVNGWGLETKSAPFMEPNAERHVGDAVQSFFKNILPFSRN